MTLFEKVGNSILSGFSRSSCKQYSLCRHISCFKIAVVASRLIGQHSSGESLVPSAFLIVAQGQQGPQGEIGAAKGLALCSKKRSVANLLESRGGRA